MRRGTESCCVLTALWWGQGSPTTVAKSYARAADAVSHSSLVCTGSAPDASSSSWSYTLPSLSVSSGTGPTALSEQRGGGAGAFSPTLSVSAAAQRSTPPLCLTPLPFS